MQFYGDYAFHPPPSTPVRRYTVGAVPHLTPMRCSPRHQPLGVYGYGRVAPYQIAADMRKPPPTPVKQFKMGSTPVPTPMRCSNQRQHLGVNFNRGDGVFRQPAPPVVRRFTMGPREVPTLRKCSSQKGTRRTNAYPDASAIRIPPWTPVTRFPVETVSFPAPRRSSTQKQQLDMGFHREVTGYQGDAFSTLLRPSPVPSPVRCTTLDQQIADFNRISTEYHREAGSPPFPTPSRHTSLKPVTSSFCGILTEVERTEDGKLRAVLASTDEPSTLSRKITATRRKDGCSTSGAAHWPYKIPKPSRQARLPVKEHESSALASLLADETYEYSMLDFGSQPREDWPPGESGSVHQSQDVSHRSQDYGVPTHDSQIPSTSVGLGNDQQSQRNMLNELAYPSFKMNLR